MSPLVIFSVRSLYQRLQLAPASWWCPSKVAKTLALWDLLMTDARPARLPSPPAPARPTDRWRSPRRSSPDARRRTRSSPSSRSSLRHGGDTRPCHRPRTDLRSCAACLPVLRAACRPPSSYGTRPSQTSTCPSSNEASSQEFSSSPRVPGSSSLIRRMRAARWMTFTASRICTTSSTSYRVSRSSASSS